MRGVTLGEAVQKTWDSLPPEQREYWGYSDIINIISAKFKIMENIKEKYILYFDTDTIFTGSISFIL